jgi:hypothetical protein
MKFSARIARDILKAEPATIVLEAVDEADATRLAMLAAAEDDPKIAGMTTTLMRCKTQKFCQWMKYRTTMPLNRPRDASRLRTVWRTS